MKKRIDPYLHDTNADGGIELIVTTLWTECAVSEQP